MQASNRMALLTRVDYTTNKSVVVFALCLLAVALTAGFGSQFGPSSWYNDLVKPAWNPPNWIFGPVWSTLYLLNAIAAWRVWRVGQSRLALSAWALHLVPNALWSYLFFGAKRIDWALVDIVLLSFSIVTVMTLFYRRDRLAAWLLAPYLAWVSFATVLNWTLFSLNLHAGP